MLACAPDPYGWSSFATELAQGASRTYVAWTVVTSLEAHLDAVASWYDHYLHRAPDPAGLSDWVGRMQQGTTEVQALAGILGSPEYQADTAGMAMDPLIIDSPCNSGGNGEISMCGLGDSPPCSAAT